MLIAVTCADVGNIKSDTRMCEIDNGGDEIIIEGAIANILQKY